MREIVVKLINPIYKAAYMLILENANSSERLLKYDVFLSCQAHSLVIEFRRYVGRLLREAFKNTRTTMISYTSKMIYVN